MKIFEKYLLIYKAWFLAHRLKVNLIYLKGKPQINVDGLTDFRNESKKENYTHVPSPFQ